MVMLTCIFNVHVDDSHVYVDIRVVAVTENVLFMALLMLMWC